MKQWKRLLTIVLVGVLALTVLAGCKTDPSDPDTEFENQTVWEAYDKLINGASDAGYNSGVTYSRKLSNVASKMLDACDGKEYSSDKEAVANGVFAAALKDGSISSKAVLKVAYIGNANPGAFGSFQYDKVYTESAYQEANVVGIAYNSSNSRLMIVAVYIPGK